MLPILWRAEAHADLATIAEFVAERNAQSALDPYNDIECAVSRDAQVADVFCFFGRLTN